jgi:hypothetical protein
MNQRWRSGRHVGVEQRRALRRLANLLFGATEAIMLAHHGFTRRTLAQLVHAGFATAQRTTGKAEDKTTGKAEAKDKAIGAGRIRITAAGRSALED